VKKDKKSTGSLGSYDKFLLQVRGCIQQENFIISINLSSKHNFTHVNLAKILHVLTKNIQGTQVEGKNVQIFKDFKITMDKYLLHSHFHATNMDYVDIVLGYPWIDLVGTINKG